jgi:hypothetical protein
MSPGRPGCVALSRPGISEPTAAERGNRRIRTAAAVLPRDRSARFRSARGRPTRPVRLTRSRRTAGSPFLTSTTGQRSPPTSRSRLRRRGPRTRQRDRGAASSQRQTLRVPRACRPHAMTRVRYRRGSGRNPDRAQVLPGQARVLPGQAQVLPGRPRFLPGQARFLPGQARFLPGQARVLTVPSPLPRTLPRWPDWAISPLRCSALDGPPSARQRARGPAPGPAAPAGVAASARCHRPCLRLHRTQAGIQGHRFEATTTRSQVRRSRPSTLRIAAPIARARAQVPSPRVPSRQVPSPRVPSPRPPAVAAAATASLPGSVPATQVRRAHPTATPCPRQQRGTERHMLLLLRPTRTAAT